MKKRFNFYFLLIVLFLSLSLVSCSLIPIKVEENPLVKDVKPSSSKQEEKIGYRDEERLNTKLIVSDGILFEDFEDTKKWVPESNYSTLETDREFIKEGSQGLKIISLGHSSFSYKSLEIDINSAKNIIFWVYVHDLESLDNINIHFSSTENWSRFLSKTVDAESNLKEGWNRILIAKSEFKSTNGETWDNISRIKIGCKTKANKETSVTFDDFRYDYQAKTIVVIAFDDGFNSVFTNAYPILSSNNQRASVFVITGRVGNEYYMSMFKLKVLKTDGWDICNHTRSHKRLTEMAKAEMEKEIDESYNWLVENGFGETAGFFAYPFGKYNEDILKKVSEKHKLAHSVIDGFYQPHIQIDKNSDIQYLLKVKNITNKTTLSNIKQRIDTAIEQNGLLILLFHNIVEDGAEETDFLPSKLQQISDYLKQKQDAGQLEVITLSQYYQLLLQE